jgi:hypothetical protein
MKNFSIIAAFKGMKIWKEVIGYQSRSLTLIVPDYEKALLNELIPALQLFFTFESQDFGKTRIIYSDYKVKETLFSSEMDFEYVQMDNRDMSCLVSYMLLTSKHYGTMWNQNVKLLSFNALYGNQLRLIADNGLYSPRYIISEKILNRI